jgi:hypothetical protein
MDKSGASVKSHHVLQNNFSEKKTIIFKNKNIFVKLWGIAGNKSCPTKLKEFEKFET